MTAGSKRPARLRLPGPLVALVVLLVVWYLAGWTGLVSESALPPPGDVLVRFYNDLAGGPILGEIGGTAAGWALGLGAGLLLGVGWGLLLALSPTLYALSRPYLMFFNSMPRVIFAPFFILLFGLGLASKVALSVSLVVFVVALGTYGAVRSVPGELVSSLELMGARRRTVWWNVLLPGALPYFLASLRVAVSLALLGVVVGEILVSTSGIGRLIAIRGFGFDVEGVFSALLALGVLAAAGNVLIDICSKGLLRWKLI